MRTLYLPLIAIGLVGVGAGAGLGVRQAGPAAAGTPRRAALRADLERIIRGPRWKGRPVERDGRVAGPRRHAVRAGRDERLAPASNMKLFTTAAALYYLGPDYRYNTFLMATGRADGVLEGDLVVYGTGDPTFSARFGGALAVWQAFADTLQALGVRGDPGRRGGRRVVLPGAGRGGGLAESYMNASYAASAGALSYAENVATLQIRPASRRAGGRSPAGAGRRGHRHREPGDDGGGRRTRSTRRAWRTTGRSWSAARSRAAARRSCAAVPVSDPARFAAAVFREMLSGAASGSRADCARR
jgi:hypothetical protein